MIWLENCRHWRHWRISSMRKLWRNLEDTPDSFRISSQFFQNFFTVSLQFLYSFFTVSEIVKKPWRNCENVVKKLWRNHEETVKKKPWRNYEEIMKKLWRNHEETVKKFWRNSEEIWCIFKVSSKFPHWRNPSMSPVYEGYLWFSKSKPASLGISTMGNSYTHCRHA